MATLVQTAPMSDTQAPGATGQYLNQLNVIGNTGVVTYVTLVASTALSVSSLGVVATTGTLGAGTYKASGTSSDGFGNSGAWAFTLTVVQSPQPQVSLVPAVPTLPSGAEIQVPFQINPTTGGVAYLTNYSAIMAQHIVSILMTVPSERVMLPTYGSILQESVFEPVNTPRNAVLANDIKKALAAWEPGVIINSVTVNTNPINQTEIDVTIKFSVAPYADVNTVTVTSGGTISQVSSP